MRTTYFPYRYDNDSWYDIPHQRYYKGRSPIDVDNFGVFVPATWSYKVNHIVGAKLLAMFWVVLISKKKNFWEQIYNYVFSLSFLLKKMFLVLVALLF